MRGFLILASFITLAVAQYDYTPPRRPFNAGGDKDTYGPPNHTPGVPVTAQTPVFSARPQPQAPVNEDFGTADSEPSFPSSGPSNSGFQAPQSQQQGEEAYGPVDYKPQVFRHVYVHAAPDEPEDRQSRTIRVPGGDKHVSIIFVKAPSSSSSHQTEVILPEQDEHKNLVYVLLKKATSSSDVKIRRPAAQAPKKPEVYFIRYGDKSSQGGYQGKGEGQGASSEGSSAGYQQPQRQHQQSSAPGGYQQQRQHQQTSAPGGYQPQRQHQHQHQQSSTGGGYQSQGEEEPTFRVPSPIRGPADIPSSGYGLPL